MLLVISDPILEPTLDRSHKGVHVMSTAGQDATLHVGAIATSQGAELCLIELLLCGKQIQIW
jgi:hypothetical protein